ncbi:MAG: DUF3105 domain-containing protein [Marmoricola sp.]
MSDAPYAPAPPPAPGPADRNRLVLVLAAVGVVLVLCIVGAVVALTGGSDPKTSAGSTPTAGCDPVITRTTDHNQQHINPPTAIAYADAPPSFGEHRPTPVPFGRPFYGADRPELGDLVHSMEHGYTIAWYDDTAAKDSAAMAELRRIAEQYQTVQGRFIAAPWHSSDGAAFPRGRHVALTRWSADAGDPADQSLQRGNWMYCGGVDRTAIKAFFDRWPNAESPEPGIL